MNLTDILLITVSVVFFILYSKTRGNPIFPLLLVLVFISEKQICQNNMDYMNTEMDNLKPVINETIKGEDYIFSNDINRLLIDKKIKLKDVIITDEGENRSVILSVQYDKYFVEVTENYRIN